MKRGNQNNIPVAEHVNKLLKRIAREMGGGLLRVGFLENAIYADGTPVAAVAFWNEFGHEGRFPSPPRPFFRTMVAKKSSGWPAQMATLAKFNNYDGAVVLKTMGQIISSDLTQSIIDTNSPELSRTSLILRAKFRNDPSKITFNDVLEANRIAYRPKDAAEVAANPLATGTQAKPLVWTGHMLDSVGYEVKGVRGETEESDESKKPSESIGEEVEQGLAEIPEAAEEIL